MLAVLFPKKRHELMKKLAVDFPNFEFVSAGLLRDCEACMV